MADQTTPAEVMNVRVDCDGLPRWRSRLAAHVIVWMYRALGARVYVTYE